MTTGTKLTIVCTAVAVVVAGAVAARSALSRRRTAVPVRTERAAFPSATMMQTDLRGAGFNSIGGGGFVARDGRTWRTEVFHHAEAGDITLTTCGDAVQVLRVDAVYFPSRRERAAPRLLEQWLPGILDVVDALQTAPYEGRPISIIGRRRFYLWLTLGPLDSTSEARRLQMELRTPTGQETLVDAPSTRPAERADAPR